MIFRDSHLVPYWTTSFTFLPLIYPVSAFFQAKNKLFFDFFSIFFDFPFFSPPFLPLLPSENVKKAFFQENDLTEKSA